MAHIRINRLGLVGTGFLVAALVSLVPAEQAFAQRQGGGRGGPGGRMGMLNSPGLNQIGLLRNPSVQTELKLTDDQKSKAAVIGDKVQEEMQGMLAELGELDPEDREAKLQELRKTAGERGKAVMAELGTILQPEQLTRLKQISLQLRGVGALADEEVAAELKLTDEQKKQLATIRTENETAGRELMRQARESGGGDAVRGKFEELRKSGNEKALAVLNADQKAQLEKLQGPKADIKFEGGPGGGGRGGRGRRPGA